MELEQVLAAEPAEVSSPIFQSLGPGTTLGPSREGPGKTNQPPAPDVAGDAGDQRSQS